MRTTWIILLAIGPAFCGCIRISGDEIHARDLASSVEAFAAADPEAVVGLAPVPGVRRILSVRDLMSVAHRIGIDGDRLPLEGVCLERALREVTEQELMSAMTEAFADKSVRIVVVDSSRYAVPQGRLVFQVAGLNVPPPSQPNAPVLWRGRVMFGGKRTMEIWARVRISAMTTLCMAATSIPAGKPIEPDQVRIAKLPRFPLRAGMVIRNIDDVVGRVARRAIPAGQEITPQVLDSPPEIRAGDTVHVLAVIGNARVSLDALATSGGRKGDTILLTNPTTHTSFKATVDGRGRALVNTGRGGRS
jgi:flagella basal body P-ring formation protein FlgA